jgi:hypothetical protein
MKGIFAISIVGIASATQTMESLFQVTTSGAHAPATIYEWVNDESTNFKVPGGVTPLG